MFYATAGGQPGDKGLIRWDGGDIHIATTVYDEGKDVVHVPAAGQTLPAVGARVQAVLDWPNALPHHARPHAHASPLRLGALPRHRRLHRR